MGTRYSIKITGKINHAALKDVSAQVDEALIKVNQQMSTWDPASEISRFNHSSSTEPFPCSEAFALVVQQALKFSKSTRGAFDPTLQPLLNLWGFGSEGEKDLAPNPAAVAAVKESIGWNKIKVPSAESIQKNTPKLSLALGAIAKGYGVDVVGRILNEAGLEDWFVEIGGEVIASGMNPDNVPWRIGIEFPTTQPLNSRLQGILHISNGAIATSGDYRNYIEDHGVIYSHILDPRTGNAVRSATASVTVFAPTCMEADAAATALFVMGVEEGLRWVEHAEQLEALFLVRAADGEITEKFSSGFKELTGYTSSL